jgi:hypothetical protein
VNRVLLQTSIGAAVVALSTVASAQPRPYSPPRLVRAEVPGEPGHLVVGGGEVLIEFIVDERGLVTRPSIVRSTPPYTEMLLGVMAGWRFEPARAINEFGSERAVETPVAVAAVFRPPTFYNGPTLGEGPREVGTLSSDVAYPVSMVTPSYPPQAHLATGVLYEVALNPAGQVVEARGFAADSAFVGVTRDALAQMSFRGGTYRSRPVPSTTYVLFVFRSPLLVPSVNPPSRDPRILLPVPSSR